MSGSKKALHVFLCALAMFSCAKNIREYRTGDDKTQCRILIAATVSDYREKIIDGIVSNYYQKCSVKVINLNNLKYVKSHDYDVIVLIDRALAWTMFNFAVRRFIDTVDEKDKVVLFLSVNSTKWKLQVNDVDGITGASKQGDADSIVERVCTEIDKRIVNNPVNMDKAN